MKSKMVEAEVISEERTYEPNSNQENIYDSREQTLALGDNLPNISPVALKLQVDWAACVHKSCN